MAEYNLFFVQATIFFSHSKYGHFILYFARIYLTLFFQVHQLLNGCKGMIIVIGWISRCLTVKAFQMGNAGLPSNTLLLLISRNQGLCTEHLHTPSNNSSLYIEHLHIRSSNNSCNTTTTIISPVNRFLCLSRLILPFLPQVVDLSRLPLTTILVT